MSGYKNVKPKGQNQQRYVHAMESNSVIFALGPAGTGKTLLAVNHALNGVDKDLYKRVVVTRPAVQAGEDIGFLPGDLNEKMDPFIKPIIDQFEFITGEPGSFQHWVDTDLLEIAPIAFMRGRTLHNACIVVDEAQNMTLEQLKMLLTRMGQGSTMIITGDPSQIDLDPIESSGLILATKILSGVSRVSTVVLDGKDIHRAYIVQDIVKAFESHRKRNASKE